MHPVVAWGINHPLKGPHTVDEAGVDPKLIEGVGGVEDKEGERGYTDEGERQVKEPAVNKLKPRLPERHREVILLALVVHRVGCPHKVKLVAQAM
jgi:hypothetical protein